MWTSECRDDFIGGNGKKRTGGVMKIKGRKYADRALSIDPSILVIPGSYVSPTIYRSQMLLADMEKKKGTLLSAP